MKVSILAKVIGALLGTLVVTVIVTIFIIVAFVYWLFGGRVVLKNNDKPIGYLRWFKYTRTC